jgi:hypothetical protein
LCLFILDALLSCFLSLACLPCIARQTSKR